MDSRQIDEASSSAYLVKNGKADELKQGEDGYFSPAPDSNPSLEAPLVFAGYGLQIPEFHYDASSCVTRVGGTATFGS